MDASYNSLLFHSVQFLFLFLSSEPHLTTAADTISIGEALTGNQTIISKDENFELGFFAPGKSLNYYIGIWYKKVSVQTKTVVWVANREKPISDPFTSELRLLGNGNLVLFNQSKTPIWSTNIPSNALNSTEAFLGDDGNLVLRDGSNPSVVIWQSFDNPTDTFLPGGKLAFNKLTHKSQLLTPWKNSEDPAPGIFSLELEPIGRQYLIRWNRFQQVWTSGAWIEQIKRFTLVPEMRLNYIYNYSYVINENESYFTYSVLNKSLISRFVIDITGQIKQLTWSDYTKQWNLFWSQPKEQCDVYGICGLFGICHQDTLKCDCLLGFEKRFPKDWGLGDTTGGCVRKTNLQCGINDDYSLMRNSNMMVNNPGTMAVRNAEECRVACANNCSCFAYSYGYESYRYCSLWTGDLLNTQQQLNGGKDLYLRIAASDIETSKDKPETDINQAKIPRNKNNLKFIIAVPIIALGTITLVILGYLYLLKRKANRKGGMFKGPKGLLIDLVKTKVTNKASQNKNMLRNDENEGEIPELQLFGFASLAIATNNFSLESKLGEGGFGPVYKGKLENGKEIAVKRLSKSSGQGIKEFKNEVILISKLQHRNLVRLLGYCSEEEENMLIYEYMPNKSLDLFLFDPRKTAHLDWNKRFYIISGIARGLLYLHRDSRLRVIHRDLKVSNILLDEDMNPKISDFGLARIFGGNQTIANTNRVVGTFGYMSPEYIMGGTFSEKSDVFSYGVLILEIVSSRRNNSFYIPDQPLNLLLNTWRLWNEGKWSDIVDQELGDSYSAMEVIRSIHVGLLCVQKRAVDRPTMSTVDFMLSNETDRPQPKEPPFTSEVLSESDILQNRCTNNNVTMTTVEGR